MLRSRSGFPKILPGCNGQLLQTLVCSVVEVFKTMMEEKGDLYFFIITKYTIINAILLTIHPLNISIFLVFKKLCLFLVNS
jgi:hypothetical protein